MKKMIKCWAGAIFLAIALAFTGCSGVTTNQSQKPDGSTFFLYPIELNMAEMNIGAIFNYVAASSSYSSTINLNNMSGYTAPRLGQKVSVNVSLSLNNVPNGFANVTGSLVFTNKNGATFTSNPIPLVANSRVAATDNVISGRVEETCMLKNVKIVDLVINIVPQDISEYHKADLIAQNGEKGTPSENEFFTVEPCIRNGYGCVRLQFKTDKNIKVGSTAESYISAAVTSRSSSGGILTLPFDIVLTKDDIIANQGIFYYPFTEKNSSSEKHFYVTYKGWLNVNSEEKYVNETLKCTFPANYTAGYIYNSNDNNPDIKISYFTDSNNPFSSCTYNNQSDSFNVKLSIPASLYISSNLNGANLISWIATGNKDDFVNTSTYYNATQRYKLDEWVVADFDSSRYIYFDHLAPSNLRLNGNKYAVALSLMFGVKDFMETYTLNKKMVKWTDQITYTPSVQNPGENEFFKAETVPEGVKITLSDKLKIQLDSGSNINVAGGEVFKIVITNENIQANKKEYIWPFAAKDDVLTMWFEGTAAFDDGSYNWCKSSTVDCVAGGGINLDDYLWTKNITASKIAETEYNKPKNHFIGMLESPADDVSDILKNDSIFEAAYFLPTVWLGRAKTDWIWWSEHRIDLLGYSGNSNLKNAKTRFDFPNYKGDTTPETLSGKNWTNLNYEYWADLNFYFTLKSAKDTRFILANSIVKTPIFYELYPTKRLKNVDLNELVIPVTDSKLQLTDGDWNEEYVQYTIGSNINVNSISAFAEQLNINVNNGKASVVSGSRGMYFDFSGSSYEAATPPNDISAMNNGTYTNLNPLIPINSSLKNAGCVRCYTNKDKSKYLLILQEKNSQNPSILYYCKAIPKN